MNCVEDPREFATLELEWDELLASSSAAGPFLRWEWLYPWWQHLAGAARLKLLTVRAAGGALVALAPLCVTRDPLTRFSRLEFLGTGFAGSDYLDVIARRGWESEALQAVAAALAEWRLALRLRHLAPGALASRLPGHLGAPGWIAATSRIAICPFIRLQGHTWDSYLGTLGANHRANVRRRLRAIDKTFQVQLERATTERERVDALNALIGFHDQRWGAERGTAFHTPALRAFHDEATRLALRQGTLRLFTLRLDGVIAAAMYGFLVNRTFYFYQHGFEPRFQQFSAGLALMALTIRAAIDEGADEFDMLYGDESYKALWSHDHRPLEQVEAFPPHFAGRLHRHTVDAERRVRHLAKRILVRGGQRAS